jgi:multidrug efflux pump subunit AcrA (membrane-fusion protein)
MQIPAFILGLPGTVRRHPWRAVFIIAPVLLVGYVVYSLSQPAAPQIIAAKVEKKDVVQLVEAVGTVVSERDLALQFPTSGIVSAVEVKEGDAVGQGQVIAVLRNADLRATVASQSANLDYAQAQLQALEEGARPEDIAISEADLANKKAALEAAKASLTTAENNLSASQTKLTVLKQQADVSLGGQVSLAHSTIAQQLVLAETALGNLDDVFAQVKLSDALTRSSPDRESDVVKERQRAGDALKAAEASVASVSSDYRAALDAFQMARGAVVQASDVLAQAYNLVSSMQEISSYTAADRLDIRHRSMLLGV